MKPSQTATLPTDIVPYVYPATHIVRYRAPANVYVDNSEEILWSNRVKPHSDALEVQRRCLAEYTQQQLEIRNFHERVRERVREAENLRRRNEVIEREKILKRLENLVEQQSATATARLTNLVHQRQMKQNVATVVSSPLEEESNRLESNSIQAWGFLDTFVRRPNVSGQNGLAAPYLTPRKRRQGPSTRIFDDSSNHCPISIKDSAEVSYSNPEYVAPESGSMHLQSNQKTSSSPPRPWLPTGEVGHNLPHTREVLGLEGILRETKIKADLQADSIVRSKENKELFSVPENIAPSNTLANILVRKKSKAVASEASREEARTLDPLASVQRFLSDLVDKQIQYESNLQEGKNGGQSKIPGPLSAEAIARITKELGYLNRNQEGSDSFRNDLQSSAETLAAIIANSLASQDSLRMSRAIGLQFATEPPAGSSSLSTQGVDPHIPVQVASAGQVLEPSLAQGVPWRPYSMGIRASLPVVQRAAPPVLAAVSAIADLGGSVNTLFSEAIERTFSSAPGSQQIDAKKKQAQLSELQPQPAGTKLEKALASDPKQNMNLMSGAEDAIDSQAFMNAVRVQRHGVLGYAYQLPSQHGNASGISSSGDEFTRNSGLRDQSHYFLSDPSVEVRGYHITGERGVDSLKITKNKYPTGIPSDMAGAGNPNRNPYIGAIPAPAAELIPFDQTVCSSMEPNTSRESWR